MNCHFIFTKLCWWRLYFKSASYFRADNSPEVVSCWL